MHWCNPNQMKKLILILALGMGSMSWSQSRIEGFIYDKANDEPLPFCSIRILVPKKILR